MADGRSECEKMLTWYNRRLAGVRVERARLEVAVCEAERTWNGVRERRADVLRDLARRNAVQRDEINRREAEKLRTVAALTENRAAWDALWARRCAQYQQALQRAVSDGAFADGRYQAASEKNRHRAALMDGIFAVSVLIDHNRVGTRTSPLDPFDVPPKCHFFFFYNGQFMYNLKVLQRQCW